MFIITACRKEEITEIDTTTVSDPTKIDGLLFKGVLTDGTKALSEVSVDVYQNEKLVGTVKSNEKGKFVTHPLKLDKDGEVTFYAQKAKYVSYARRLKGQQGKINELSMRMVSVTEALIVPEALENPGSASLISISGQVFKTNGAPEVDAGVLLMYDIVEIPNEISGKGSFVFTDQNGYYETLLPKNQVFHYLVFANQDECDKGEIVLTPQEVKLLDLYFKLIGPYTTNVTLPTLNNAPVPSNKQEVKLTVDGVFNNCQGGRLDAGTAEVEVQIGTFRTKYEDKIINGKLINTQLSYCLVPVGGVSPVVTILAKDNVNNKKSDIKQATVIGDKVNFGNVQVCQDTPPTPVASRMNVKIGTRNYDIRIALPDTTINCGIVNDTLIMPYSGIVWSNNGFLRFKITNPLDLSDKVMLGFRYLAPDNYNYNQETNVINITNVTRSRPGVDNCFSGVLSGMVINRNTLLLENLSGKITVCY